ncbi:MAG: HD domain-containing protein [Anaerolineae bacterium]|nr:HD domain-containing protein [Anaerolineae bacterium]
MIDLHGGLNDLDAGVIRAVSDDAIRSDPLRALRAVRQAAQLGFTLASETEALIRRDGVALANVSAERICDELSKLLACASSAPYLFELDRLGLLVTILPELEPLRDLRQSPPHQHAVLQHSLETVAALEFLLGELGYTAASREGTGNEPLGAGPELGSLLDYAGKIGEHLDAVVSDTRRRVVVLKMAALLHDVGKAGARSVDGDERIRFLGHEQAGSRVAGLSLQRLRFSSAEARLVETIVRCHMRPLTLASQDRVSTRALYRFFRDAGDAGVDVLLLSLADHLATYAVPSGGSGWQPLVGSRWLVWSCGC